MPRKPSSNPTEVELQILAVLWERGPSTVREVHNALRTERDTGYSTTLKMMQVMTEKGLLLKNDRKRPQVFRPAISQEKTQVQYVDDLIQRVFGGAADKLVLRAITSRNVSAGDLEKIKKLISEMGGDAS